jgi:hypothetical protein
MGKWSWFALETAVKFPVLVLKIAKYPRTKFL